MIAGLRISGYASIFGKPDISGNIVRPGAFSESLLSKGDGCLPLLFNHAVKNPIGVWDQVFEDQVGLFVSGRILTDSAQGSRIARLVSDGAVNGLSIGYRALRYTPRFLRGRSLTELDLWEISVVAYPMLRTARITEIGEVRKAGAAA